MEDKGRSGERKKEINETYIERMLTWSTIKNAWS